MNINYSAPGVELYHLSPGFPTAFKGLTIKGAEQCYIIDNFGQTVNQSVASTQTSFTLQYMEWHNSRTEIKSHHEFSPGLYTCVLLDKRLIEKIRGLGTIDMHGRQFLSFTGSSFTSAAAPETGGQYLLMGCGGWQLLSAKSLPITLHSDLK